VDIALVSKNFHLWSMLDQRVKGHTLSRLTVHIVWSTKYLYLVLEGGIQKVFRVILIQICDVEWINILEGVVSKDHVHMYLEYGPSQDISSIVKKLRGRSSRRLRHNFPKSQIDIEGDIFG
jgi:putative transposase